MTDILIRYLLPLLVSSLISVLSTQTASLVYGLCFLAYSYFALIDLLSVKNSLYEFWLSASKNLRKGVLGTSTLLLKLALSSLVAFCFLCQSLYLSGILSATVVPHVENLHVQVINQFFRSGFALCFLWFENSLQSDGFTWLSDYLNARQSATIMAFCFIATAFALSFPVFINLVAIPYLIVSVFYALEILDYTLIPRSNQSDSPLITISLLLIHTLALAFWALVFTISFNLMAATLPTAIATVISAHMPILLLINTAEITTQMVCSLSTVGVFIEYSRDFACPRDVDKQTPGRATVPQPQAVAPGPSLS